MLRRALVGTMLEVSDLGSVVEVLMRRLRARRKVRRGWVDGEWDCVVDEDWDGLGGAVGLSGDGFPCSLFAVLGISISLAIALKSCSSMP